MPIKLGSNFYYKIKFIFVSFIFFINFKIGLSAKKEYKIEIKYKNKKFNLFTKNRTDLDVLKEILINSEYAFDYGNNVSTIVDLGGNIGITTIFYHSIFPNAKIYTVEPLPDNFSRLVKNTKDIDNKKLFNCAIDVKGGISDFYIFDSDAHQSSSVIERKKGQKKISVKTKSLDGFISEESIKIIDILKFDIEGAEFSVFKNFKNFKKIKYLVGEVHPDIFGKSLDDFLEFFRDSFDIIKIKEENNIVLLKNRFL